MADARTTAILSQYLAPKADIAKAYEKPSAAPQELLGRLTGTSKFANTGRNADNIGESIDSLTGVPLRTAISEAQAGNFNIDAAKKIAASIGSDPRTAPTGYDIASKVTDNPILGAALATGVDVANLPLPVKPGVSATVGKVAEKARKTAANAAVVQHIKSTPAIQTAIKKLQLAKAAGEQVGKQPGVVGMGKLAREAQALELAAMPSDSGKLKLKDVLKNR